MSSAVKWHFCCIFKHVSAGSQCKTIAHSSLSYKFVLEMELQCAYPQHELDVRRQAEHTMPLSTLESCQCSIMLTTHLTLLIVIQYNYVHVVFVRSCCHGTTCVSVILWNFCKSLICIFTFLSWSPILCCIWANKEFLILMRSTDLFRWSFASLSLCPLSGCYAVPQLTVAVRGSGKSLSQRLWCLQLSGGDEPSTVPCQVAMVLESQECVPAVSRQMWHSISCWYVFLCYLRSSLITLSWSY